MEKRPVTLQQIPASSALIDEINQQGKMDRGVEVVFPCGPGRRMEDFFGLEMSLRDMVMPLIGEEDGIKKARAAMSALSELLGKQSNILEMPVGWLMSDKFDCPYDYSFSRTGEDNFHLDIPTKLKDVHYHVSAVPLNSHGAIKIRHFLSTESMSLDSV
jgi:hypothetical protein